MIAKVSQGAACFGPVRIDQANRSRTFARWMGCRRLPWRIVIYRRLFHRAFMNQHASFLESIERRLCEIGNLVSGQFPMTSRPLIRAGKPVGNYFCVHGPRSVKLTAIHDIRDNQIIFYGSDGVRRTCEAAPAT